MDLVMLLLDLDLVYRETVKSDLIIHQKMMHEMFYFTINYYIESPETKPSNNLSTTLE